MIPPFTDNVRASTRRAHSSRSKYSSTFLLLVITAVYAMISQIRTWNLLVERTKHDLSLFQSKQPKANTRHAYAFLMAGCDPLNSNTYIGYVYNILVADYILRHSGSNSDIVVLVRMSTDSNIDARLPPNITSLLESSGIHIEYIPKVHVDNFYSAQMAKFHILNLVQYDRVLFMDSDVMPFGNLDYIFHLSKGDNPSLQENVILEWNIEPAAGGFFMLTPNQDDFLRLQKIQRDQLLQYKGTFDIVQGWGHVIQPNDRWESISGEYGTNWTFYGSSADQGLLYYWVKYVKKKVSIIKFNRVETWRSSTNTSTVKLIETRPSTDVFGDAKNRSSILANYQLQFDKRFNCLPHSDFEHFTGEFKPWMGHETTSAYNETQTVFNSPRDLWYHILQKVAKEKNVQLDCSGIGLNALGLWPTEDQLKLMYDAMLLEELF